MYVCYICIYITYICVYMLHIHVIYNCYVCITICYFFKWLEPRSLGFVLKPYLPYDQFV